MKDVVYIIPLTPTSHLTPLRRMFFDLTIQALNAQKSANWEALLIGEFDKKEGNLTYLPAKALDANYVKPWRSDPGHTDKHFKVDVAMQYINSQSRKPKYLARLDDDDIMSPDIVSVIERSGDVYDCFTDKYQVMYNVTNGKFVFTNLPWMPNTMFHKYEHANVPIAEFGFSLINCSHNFGYHKYYAGKKVWYSPKDKPLYIRTLSPTNLNLLAQEGKITFEQHVKKWGFWHYKELPGYEVYIKKLIAGYEGLTGTKIRRDLSASTYMKSLISYTADKYKEKFNRRILHRNRTITPSVS